ncbi:MAG: aminopeptidase P family protein [Oscillospiraceae bacterium]|nr:aminopeptidase P family protein [Oscillospiraceae bacterium]
MPSPMERLCQSLPKHAAALIEDSVSRRFLTGFSSSAGMLLLCREGARLYVDSRYIEAARREVKLCPAAELTDKKEQLLAFCGEFHCDTLLLERARVTVEHAERIRAWCGGSVRVNPRSPLLDDTLRELRLCKSAEALAAIQRAQGIAEAAFARLRGLLRPGMTELEIALELDFAMRRGGAEAVAFDTIAVAGENGANPHGVPGARPLREGDLLTLDFGAVVEGYHSDMTRTLAIGVPVGEARRVYDTVWEAQRAALAVIGPGVPCKAVDTAAREVIASAGYGEHFRHGTGHGVGLEVHEAPTLSAKSEEILRPGNVVTVEPGIYIPGFCGVRIEDMVYITEAGYENLTHVSARDFVVDVG